MRLRPLCVFALLPCLMAQSPPAGPRVRALLVGIADYPLPSGPSDTRQLPSRLQGPHNDLDRVEYTLRDHYGFGSEDIVRLADEDATHERIVAALYELGKSCGPRTDALFWYSGHGSVVPDASGREDDKGMSHDGKKRSYDGSLVAYDSRAKQDVNRDLIDDELYSLLRFVAGRCHRLVVVTDSCYSGGVTRGGGTARFQPGSQLPWDKAFALKLLPPEVPLLDDDAPQRAVDARNGPAWVHIAACSDDEVAREQPVDGGREYGLLTWYLTSAMADAQRPGSWRELALGVRAAISANDGAQTVWFEGALDSPVLGDTFRPTPPGFAARGGANGQVLVDAGRLQGLGEGSEVALYDLLGAQVGRAKAKAVLTAGSTFAFDGTPPTNLAGRALVARPQGQPGSRAPLRLRLAEGVPAGALAGSTWATATPDGEDGGITRSGDTLWLQDPAGYRARELPADPAGRELALFREHGYRLLRQFPAARGKRTIGLEVVPTAAEATKECKLPAATTRERGDGRIEVLGAPLLTKDGRGGALATFRVRNPGRTKYHVALLSVCEDRSVHLLWPTLEEPDNLLAPGASREVLATVGPSPDWREPRPMVDRYVAIATAEYADFVPFCSEATLEVLLPDRGGDPCNLPPALALAHFSGSTRGAGIAARAASAEAATDFGVACLDLLLVAPGQPARK